MSEEEKEELLSNIQDVLSEIEVSLKNQYENTIKLNNKELRKLIENSNWNFLLQVIRYGQQENEQLKKQLEFDIKLRDENRNYLHNQIKQRDEVIEEAIKYITSEEYFELNNYMSISESQNKANYFKAHDKLLDILNKYKGDNND